jgi:hemolysin activation/secretion protein
MGAGAAIAQTPYPGHSPGDRPLERPDYLPPGEAPALTLPPVEQAFPRDTLAGRAQVLVKAFRIEGNRAIATEELQRIAAPYTGRPISSEELQALRQRLTRHYVERGFVNSGVVIPDQQVRDGIVTLRVMEGRLGEIRVEGLERLRPDYVRERLELGAGPPLNVRDLAERLLLLQQDPLVRRLDAQLGPGEQRGEGQLRVRVEEARPYSAAVILDNERPPSVGAERLRIEGEHRNLSGRGDALQASYGLTSGMDDLSLAWSLPLDARDTRLTLSYERTDSEVVEAPFDELDIESDTRSWGIALRRPVIKHPDREFALTLALENRRNNSYLEGRPFSFSAGANDGESEVTVLRFAQEWSQRGTDRVWALRSTFSKGLDALGATINPDSPDGRFLSWLGQARWARRLEGGLQLLARTDMQLSDGPLLDLEKIAVGGIHSVRGYRENQMVRDNAVVASLELRIPLGGAGGAWQLAPFLDYGRAWNRGEQATPSPPDISSIGVGVRWDPGPAAHAELYWGKALRKVDSEGDDLQDDGIHFSARWQFY